MPFCVLYDYLQLRASLCAVAVALCCVFFYMFRFWLEEGQDFSQWNIFALKKLRQEFAFSIFKEAASI